MEARNSWSRWLSAALACSPAAWRILLGVPTWLDGARLRHNASSMRPLLHVPSSHASGLKSTIFVVESTFPAAESTFPMSNRHEAWMLGTSDVATCGFGGGGASFCPWRRMLRPFLLPLGRGRGEVPWWRWPRCLASCERRRGKGIWVARPREALLPLLAVGSQNGYSICVGCWKTVLRGKSPVHDLFLHMGHPFAILLEIVLPDTSPTTVLSDLMRGSAPPQVQPNKRCYLLHCNSYQKQLITLPVTSLLAEPNATLVLRIETGLIRQSVPTIRFYINDQLFFDRRQIEERLRPVCQLEGWPANHCGGGHELQVC